MLIRTFRQTYFIGIHEQYLKEAEYLLQQEGITDVVYAVMKTSQVRDF